MKHPEITIIEYNDAMMILKQTMESFKQASLDKSKQHQVVKYKVKLESLLIKLNKNRMERIEYLSE